MAVVSFQIIKASQLNRIQPVPYFAQQTGNAGSQQTITTTETDLLGCTVTFTTATAATVKVTGIFDVETTVVGAAVFEGRLRVDGATLSNDGAHFGGQTLDRATVAQVWDFTLSGAGSHTLTLRGIKTAAAATILTDDLHTRMSVDVREIV